MPSFFKSNIMAFQPIFLRNDTFVVVVPIKLTSEIIIPAGEEITLRDYPTHRLVCWHRKRWIAKSGCEWANDRLAAYKEKSEKSKTVKIEKTLKNDPVSLEREVKKKRKYTKSKNV